MVGTEIVWFSAHWASMPYILPISWWLNISTCFRFSSKSSAHQAGAKPCDLSATREGPQARFYAITGTDAARLPGDFTSWTPWIGQASKICGFYNHKSHVISQWLWQPLPADPDNRTKRNIRLSSSRCSLLRCFPDIGLRWNSCRLMERPSNVVFVGHEILTIDFIETLTYF